MAAAAGLPAIISLASIGLGAGSSIMSGIGTKTADDYKAARLQRAAEIGRVAAVQTGTEYTEQLTTTLGNIDAIRAAAHTDPTSPTGVAVRDYQERVGERQKNIAVSNILSKAAQDEADAAYLRSAGKFALLGGVIGAGAKIGGSAGGTNFANFGFGSSSNGMGNPGQIGSLY